MSSESKKIPQPDYLEHDSRVINEFGLSNSEWLRFRMTGELPERSQPILDRRFKDQGGNTIAKPKKDVIVEPKSLDTVEGENSEYSKYKNEIKNTLFEIKGLCQGAFDNSNSGVISGMLSELDKSMERFISDIRSDNKLTQEILDILSKIIVALSSVESEGVENKAYICEAILYSEKIIFNVNGNSSKDKTEDVLNKFLKDGEIEMLGILLERDSIISNLVFSFLDDKSEFTLAKKVPDETVLKFVKYIANSLNVYLKKLIDTAGLEFIGFPSIPLQVIVRKLLEREEVYNQLKQEGFDFKSLVDNYVGIIAEHADKIGGGYPSHFQCEVMCDTIKSLYGPVEVDKRKPSKELRLLLHKLYLKKVLDYSSSTKVHPLDASLREVADISGLKYEEVKSVGK